MKNFLVLVAIGLISLSSFAQSKVGTVNSDLLVASLPEVSQLQKDMKDYGASLDKEYNLMLTQYQDKIKIYEEKQETALEASRIRMEDEIVKLEQDLRKFQQNSQNLIQLKQNELMRPLFQKVGVALESVAKEQGYTQVLTMNSVAYYDENQDLTKAVAEKLGVTLQSN